MQYQKMRKKLIGKITPPESWYFSSLSFFSSCCCLKSTIEKQGSKCQSLQAAELCLSGLKQNPFDS